MNDDVGDQVIKESGMVVRRASEIFAEAQRTNKYLVSEDDIQTLLAAGGKLIESCKLQGQMEFQTRVVYAKTEFRCIGSRM